MAVNVAGMSRSRPAYLDHVSKQLGTDTVGGEGISMLIEMIHACGHSLTEVF